MIDELYDNLPECYKSERFLYRGFSIEKTNGIIIIKDIRSPYYRDVSSEDMAVLLKRGFIKGSTYLLMLSDKRKVEIFKSLENKNRKSAHSSRNPRKKQEYLNSVRIYIEKANYYESQVSRWHKQLKNT